MIQDRYKFNDGREHMVDKITFMETLHSVQEIVKASPEPMSKEEIKGYFQDMELSEEQQEMVYQFLLTPQKEDAETEGEGQDFQGGEQPQAKTKGRTAPKAAKQSKNPHFQMYLREISAVPSRTKEQQNILYQRLLAGEESVMEEISHQWLKKIIRIAEEYATANVFLEDLVQEGNISLLLGLRQLPEKGSEYGLDSAEKLEAAQQKRLEKHLEELVREGMQQYRQELEGEADSENTILAKVSLVYEARKALAEENGTDPTIQELCAYTRIPPEEIADILTLHEKARKKP